MCLHLGTADGKARGGARKAEEENQSWRRGGVALYKNDADKRESKRAGGKEFNPAPNNDSYS